MQSVNIFKASISGFENPIEVNVETSLFLFGSGTTILFSIPVFLVTLAFFSPLITGLIIGLSFYTFNSVTTQVMTKWRKEKVLDDITKNLDHEEDDHGVDDHGVDDHEVDEYEENDERLTNMDGISG